MGKALSTIKSRLSQMGKVFFKPGSCCVTRESLFQKPESSFATKKAVAESPDRLSQMGKMFVNAGDCLSHLGKAFPNAKSHLSQTGKVFANVKVVFHSLKVSGKNTPEFPEPTSRTNSMVPNPDARGCACAISDGSGFVSRPCFIAALRYFLHEFRDHRTRPRSGRCVSATPRDLGQHK